MVQLDYAVLNLTSKIREDMNEGRRNSTKR